MSTVHFDCDTRLLGLWSERLIAAGGTLVNLGAGGLMLGLLRRVRRVGAPGALLWFLWLAMATNLLTGTGYFLFSGVSGIGDWAEFSKGLGAVWVDRLALTLLGASTYWFVVLLAVRELAPLLAGAGPGRVRSAARLTVPAYVAGGVQSCVAGLFNPVGMVLVAISAAAGSFGGTSGLAWMPQLLHGKRWDTPVPRSIVIQRSWVWIGAAVVTTAVFIVVLSPGLRFGMP
jgi:hypothetical protein